LLTSSCLLIAEGYLLLANDYSTNMLRYDTGNMPKPTNEMYKDIGTVALISTKWLCFWNTAESTHLIIQLQFTQLFTQS